MPRLALFEPASKSAARAGCKNCVLCELRRPLHRPVKGLLHLHSLSTIAGRRRPIALIPCDGPLGHDCIADEYTGSTVPDSASMAGTAL